MLANINTPEDIANHKNYKLEYEHWLADLKDPLVKQNISKNFQKAQVFEEAFTEEEISWMYGYAFSQCGTVRHNDNGTMFISGNLQGVYEKFADRINQMVPGAETSPVVGGNFFITPSQYGLHNDSTRESDWQNSLSKTPADSASRKYVPWRNIIIPLFTAPSNIESHGVFFDQRHVDFAHVYHHGKKPEQTVATTYPIVENHADVDFCLLDGSIQDKETNLVKYNKDHYDEYLYYTPYRRLTGLSPELTCEWKPRAPIVFDAVQLHATNKGRQDTHWTTKMGLLLTFLREIK
tara:strand:- start:5589 stop:6467 length:879 start_codon:yes stop_codon:yes gene_type:complete